MSRETLAAGQHVRELVGEDGEGGGGVSGVDVLAFDQLLGDKGCR